MITLLVNSRAVTKLPSRSDQGSSLTAKFMAQPTHCVLSSCFVEPVYMSIKLVYCLVCPFFFSQDMCDGATKAPITICQSVVLRLLLCTLALSMTPKRVQKWV